MAGKTSANPNEFILPDLGEGVHEAELIKWRVSPGDTVAEHDILAEMETDKALVEVPSPRACTIAELHGSEGEVLNVGNVLVTYGDGAAAPASTAKSEPAPTATEAEVKPAEREDDGTVVGNMSGAAAGITAEAGKVLAAPAVRRLARDLGVDLNTVQGTGSACRVTAKDARAAADGSAAPKPAAPSAPKPTAPTETRRPLPAAPAQPAPMQAPQYQQPLTQPMPQPGYQQQPAAYAQQQQPMQPGMPMGYSMPMPMMLVPMMMPGAMPGMMGMPGQQQAPGLPAAPGFVPSTARAIPDPAQSAQVPGGQGEARTPFRGVRRTLAERLRESVNTAVHFTVMDEADVTALDDLRRQTAQQTGVKLSFLPFVAAAVCRALTGRFGAMNATVDDAAGEIVQHGPVHLGIATDTDNGLMVPVIPNAHTLDPIAMAQAIADTAKSARDRTIPRDRLMGSTFTISNVGSHAGKFATPVINYPEVAILAVGKVYDGVVVRNGQPAVGKLMPLSLACDHRVVDGATAALALAEIVESLQSASV